MLLIRSVTSNYPPEAGHGYGTSSAPPIGCRVVESGRWDHGGSWAPGRIASRLLQTAIDTPARLVDSPRAHASHITVVVSAFDTLHSNGGTQIIHPAREKSRVKSRRVIAFSFVNPPTQRWPLLGFVDGQPGRTRPQLAFIGPQLSSNAMPQVGSISDCNTDLMRQARPSAGWHAQCPRIPMRCQSVDL